MPEANDSRTIGDKVQSRKFLATVFGVAVNLYFQYTGALDPKTAAQNIMVLIGLFVVGQAIVDSGFLQGVKLNQIAGGILSPATQEAVKKILEALANANGKTNGKPGGEATPPATGTGGEN